jgi:hypothetical protein
MQQQEYQEDKLGVLGMAQGVAKASILPQYQYMYNPAMFRPMSGRIMNPNMGSVNWIGNQVAKGYGSLFGADAERSLRVSTKFTARKLRKGANSLLGNLGLDISDGSFGLDNKNFSQRGSVKALDRQIAKANLASDTYRNSKIQDRFNSASKRLHASVGYSGYFEGDDLKVAKAKKFKLAARRLGEQTKTDKFATSLSRMKAGIKNANPISLINGRSWYGTTYTGSTGAARLQMAGLRAQKVGLGALQTVGRAGARIGILGAKLGAYGAVASLMWDATSMVFNPIAQAGVQAIDNTFSKLEGLGRPELGGQLNMAFLSQGAATDRQRAIQAISQSRLNGRSILGQEAQYMHQ